MKKLVKCITVLIFALSFMACGSTDARTEYAGSSEYSSDSVNEAEAYDGGYLAESYMAMPEPGLAQAKTEGAGGTSNTSESEDEKVTGIKLVYTGSITVETMEYENTMKDVRSHIKKYNGIIENENEWDGDHSWYYNDGRARTTNRNMSMTVRIPTKDFDAFMSDMDGAGKVTSRSQNVENISRRYSDNSIEIESLEKQQTRLMEMMDKATTVEEMIMIEERLSDVQTRLNQKKSYRSTMDTDVEYSTIYLNVNEVQKYTPVEDPGININGFGKRVMETLEYSWKFFVYVVQGLILLVIRIAPFAIVALLIIFGVRKYRVSKGLNPNPFYKEKKFVPMPPKYNSVPNSTNSVQKKDMGTPKK